MCMDLQICCTFNVGYRMAQGLSSLVNELRRAGGDSTSIEVKAAAGGLPDSLTSSLSALAGARARN